MSFNTSRDAGLGLEEGFVSAELKPTVAARATASPYAASHEPVTKPQDDRIVSMNKVTRTTQGLQEALRQGSWTSALGPLGFVALVLLVMAIIAISSR